MILRFANHDALRVALSSGLVPAQVQACAVRWSSQPEGVDVAPQAPLDDAVLAVLRRAGVGEAHQVPDQRASCWAEVLPLVACTLPASLPEVLFVVAHDADALDFAGELLRLGCDRQRLAFTPQGVVLRVAHPPYYSVLRALEGDARVRAYLPLGAVWLALGWSHPLQAQLQAPRGVLRLLAPDGWRALPDGPWRDLYSLLSLDIGPTPPPLAALPAPRRLQVKLQLQRSAQPEAPSLWLLEHDAIDAVDALVHSAPDSLLACLEYAVAGDPDQPTVLLRARPQRSGPPSLGLDAQGYVQLAELHNLYRPAGWRLAPPLRRDSLRELLAPAPGQIGWLVPEEGGLRLRRLAEEGFAPLSDWVDYLVQRDAEALAPWVAAVDFALEDFCSIGREWEATEPAPGVPSTQQLPAASPAAPAAPPPRRTRVPAPELEPSFTLPLPPAPLPSPSQAQRALTALEREFLALDLPSDHPDRVPLWWRLGELTAALGRERDAGLCWTRAVWEGGGDEPVSHWLSGELGLLGLRQPRQALQRLLSRDAPHRGELRAMAALLCWAASGRPLPALSAQLQRVSSWLDQHDDVLDVRSLWLAQEALAQLVGGDLLRLSRARDRLLGRLHQGLSLERDVPTFLRFLGPGVGGDSDVLSTLVTALEQLLSQWQGCDSRKCSVIEAPLALTDAYVRCVLAVGFARLGQVERAQGLHAQGLAALDLEDPVHDALSQLFGARLVQAIEGLPPEAPLPSSVAERLDALDAFQRYKVDRLRQVCGVLAAGEHLDPATGFQRGRFNPHAPALSALRGVTDPLALIRGIDGVLDGPLVSSSTPEERARLLDDVMGFVPRLPSTAALSVLERVLGLLDDQPPPRLAELLARGLLLAGELGRPDLVGDGLSRLREALRAHPARELAHTLGAMGWALRGLRRLGLRDQAQAALTEMLEAVQADSLPALVARLHVSASLIFFGAPQAAQAALSDAFERLERPLNVHERLQLSRAMVEALAQLPHAQALEGLARVGQQLPLISDSLNTNSHFCLSLVRFIDLLVLGYANEDLCLGELGRRWLDEDEYLVRRRVHRALQRG